MIQEIRCALQLPQIFALAHHIPDITPERFKDIVLERLVEIDSTFVVEKHDSYIRAFAFCTVDRFQGGPAYVVQYAYADPEAYSAGSEVFSRCCAIAKEKGFKEVYMMTSRNPEGFVRKYKFENFRYILKRSMT